MLACILGNGGEVFFPKLGEDQMLTFSSICDKFVTANKLVKHECGSDAEAKAMAAEIKTNTDPSTGSGQENLTEYPVVYFKSDTTGEKAYEEFYIPGERINMNRFMALGVVEETLRRAQGRPVYPELVEGRRGRTWTRRCSSRAAGFRFQVSGFQVSRFQDSSGLVA